ncbi:MAG: TetR/AcrR family transcriptional regulator [Synergistaceae bacterium]|nr:TetR/AcrR family transcriptional regulator [Synergistaceae bacterium]
MRDGALSNNNKRLKLIEAAIDEFNEFGIENASYNRIIERSGMSKGSVYYHFDNKDALLAIVMEEIGERVLKAVPERDLPQSKDEFWQSLWDYRQREFDFFATHIRLGRILIMSLDVPDFDIKDINNLCAPLTKLLHRQINLIKRGQELGAVRNDLCVDLIFNLMRAVDKSLCVKFFGREAEDILKLSESERRESSKNYTRLFKDLIRRMLEPNYNL